MSQPTPPQARPPKAMSSRLMTMKFMQRAAASIPPSTPQSQSQAASTPPSKRQKLSNGTPSLNTTPSESELIQSALDEDAAKREEAIERLAEEAGETKWVLSTVNGDPEAGVKGLRVAMAGYSDIDQDALRPAMQGRKSFGKFKRELGKRRNDTADRDSSSSDGSSTGADENSQESQESDDPAGTGELIRVAKRKAERLERKQQRKAEQTEIARLAEKRRSKGVNLNRLSSISGGNASAGKSSAKGNRECFQCGEKGHEKRECPHKEQRGDEDGRGGRSKTSRSSLAY